MVYSLFHASNAHVLLSGFFVFLPQQWRGLDLEWLHAEIRDAQRDMKRWVELCRRWDLEPGLFPTADAARGLPAQQAITGTVQTRKDDGTLLLSRSGSHVRSNLPSASAIPALTVGKKVSENQGNSIIDGAGPQTFDGSRSTPPPHYQRNESAKTETSKVVSTRRELTTGTANINLRMLTTAHKTASPRPDLNISTSPSQDIPSTPRFSPLTPPRNATAGSETSSPSSPLSPVPEAFNNPRGAPPPPFGNMSSFGLYTEDNFDDGVEPFRAPSRTRSRRKSRRTSNSAAASLETISFRRLTRSTRQVNADNTKTKGTLDGSPSLGNDSEPRPTKIESTVDNDTFDAALTLQSLTSETGAAVVTSESIKAQTPSKTPKSIINQPRANKRKTNNSLSDSVDLDQDFGFLSSPPGPQIVPNRRVSGVTSQTIRDENPGSPPSASDVAHVGPVYRTIRDILARESEPYVHAACGARCHHPDDVIIHHLRRDERACEHVLDKKIRW